MGFYQNQIVPLLINVSMRQKTLAVYRNRIVTAAEDRVLEIGIGSGLNLPFYSSKARQVIGLDPSPKLLGMARRRASRLNSRQVQFIESSAEKIPLEDASADTIVTTWTLCSIPAVLAALDEMRRVLRPTGRLLFVEASDADVRRWQDRLTPLWKRLGGGCHLNRPIQELIEAAGFKFDHLETGYMRGPKVLTFMYEGSAHRR